MVYRPPLMGLYWSGLRDSCSLVSTSPMNYHGPNTPKTVMKRARQHLFPLRRLKRFDMGRQILKKLNSCTIESILSSCITAWYGNCLASDCKALQSVVRTAQYITDAKLPAIQDLYNSGAQKVVRDSSTPSHRLFSLLPHGKWYRIDKSRTKWILDNFYPQAIRLLNNSSNGHRTIHIDTHR